MSTTKTITIADLKARLDRVRRDANLNAARAHSRYQRGADDTLGIMERVFADLLGDEGEEKPLCEE